jgi:hypothetical protein
MKTTHQIFSKDQALMQARVYEEEPLEPSLPITNFNGQRRFVTFRHYKTNDQAKKARSMSRYNSYDEDGNI